MSGLESIAKLRKLSKEVVDMRWGVEFDRAIDALEAEVSERFMEMPVDADCVPIRLGDMMDGVGMYDSLRDVTGEVIEISFNATDNNECVASVALQVWSEDGKSWRRVYIDQYANVYRHVKPRTLEGILREFTDAVFRWNAEAGTVADTDTWSELAEPYAAEIRELMEASE